MSPRPKISIVIPTFNAEAYLGQCLSSIRKQAYPNLEVLIIDGGSKDGTANVVDRYSDFVTTFLSETDRGQPDAVTKGLRLATGEIAHWHASDDVILPGALDRAAEAFAADPHLALTFSDGIAFDTRAVYGGAHVRFVDFWTSLLFFGRFQSDCAYWCHRFTESALPLDDDKQLTCDEDFFLRLWAGRPHKWISQPLGAFRIRAGQLSQQLSKSDLSQQRAKTRSVVRRRLGISEAQAARLRVQLLPQYLIGLRIAPRAYAGARFAMRTITLDRGRQQQTRWFFDEWLPE